MFDRKLLAPLFLACLIAGPLVAGEAPDAARRYDDGRTLLGRGDLAAAYQAFAEAAKADPENEQYRKLAMTMKRVLALQKFVDENEPSEKWEKMVGSLHAFYLRNDAVKPAISLDRRAHEKLKSAFSASLLAESLLEADRNGEAAKFLGDLDGDLLDCQNRIYLSIALARLGDAGKAAEVAASNPLPEDAGPGLLYDFARYDALAGRAEQALERLTLLFQKTPPSSLPMLRTFVKRCSDFRSLASCEAFPRVMKTASLVKESKCSGGSGCGSCKMKGSSGGCDKDGGGCDKDSGGCDKDSGGCEEGK